LKEAHPGHRTRKLLCCVNTSIVSKILLATDFSDSALLAQVYTEYLAVALKASAVVLHVSEHPSAVGTGSQVEKDLGAELRALQESMGARAIPLTIQRSRGNPGDQILSAAQDLNADLIAMGVQGHTHVPYGLMGDTIQTVTTNAPCPVLSVPLPHKAASPCMFTAPAPVNIRRILAPVDFSGPSLDSLECAIHLAHDLAADLVLVHVLEPVHADWKLAHMQGAAQMRDEWERRLGELSTAIKSLGLSAAYEMRAGFPPDSILAGALQHQCDLIVMGTHGRRGRGGMNVGSVAEAVLKEATCPVVTVRNPRSIPGVHPEIRGVLSQQKQSSSIEDRQS
jgi:nucleotide-binding universal stress UspA family protein